MATASVILIAGGLACAVLAAIPFDVIQPLGRHIRRADDLTPERHRRLVQVSVAFALFGMTAGVLLWRRRNDAAASLRSLLRDFGTALRRAPAAMRSWGLCVWALITLGIGLRAMHLNDSMAYDEAYTFNNLARQSLIVGIADYNSTNNHLLNTLLMHCSWRLFGDAEWALRLPVFVIGGLLLPLLWIWSSRWVGRPIAAVTLALAAVSPFLITYSTDARGYIMVTAAAIALDDAAARWFDPKASRSLAWLQSVLAAALGLCAMPIGLYAIASVAAWVIARTAFRLDRHHVVGFGMPPTQGADAPRSPVSVLGEAISASRWPLLTGLLVFCLIVGGMYSPAYVFRGSRAMHDPILQPVSVVAQTKAQWQSLAGAWEWWTTGVPPAWAWTIGLVLGVVCFRSTWADRVRWLALPASMLVLHLAGQVAPPPRVFIVLLPWIALLTAAGWVTGVSSRGRYASRASLILATIVAIGGTVYAATHPVLIFPKERASFRSVREAMVELKGRIEKEPNRKHRLIAPLPCDLPSIFYRDRESIPVEINGQPAADEVVWLLAREGETPEDVLRTPLIDLPDVAAGRAPFEPVAKLETLDLFRSPPP
jgi:hypothetical protein